MSFKLPPKLAKYNAALWQGRDDAERYGEWMDARREWKDARDIISLPDDEAASAAFPDGEWRIEDI
jgi:hypothetical protein